MAVYAYIRVSTKSQAEEGLGLDAQRRIIEGYAMMHGLEIDQVFEEKAVSGWKPIGDRPAGGRLIATISPGDTILCAKLDRMFRSARDALVVGDSLRAKGVSLHLMDLGGDVTGNGISKLFFTMVAAFAEFERDRIAERICDVKVSEKSKGRYLGGARPFGYRIAKGGQLIADEKEQKVIAKIRALRNIGYSLRSISTELANQGHRLSHVTVKRILLSG